MQVPEWILLQIKFWDSEVLLYVNIPMKGPV